jgi:septum formation protein
MRPNLLNPLGPKLRLASRSPRRAELLTLVGAHFEIAPVELDESALPGERPDAHVLRLAEAKARASRAALDAGGTP